MSWTKPKKRAFAALMREYLETVAEPSESYQYVMQTKFGALRIAVYDSTDFRTSLGPWVAARFDDPKLAIGRGLRISPHSAKWNFHCFDVPGDDPTAFFEHVRDSLENIRQTESV